LIVRRLQSSAGTAFACDDDHKRAHFTPVFVLVKLSSKAMSDMTRRKFMTLLGSDSVALWLMPWRRNVGPWIGRKHPYPYPSLC
jgi:hypothetical protein